MILNLNDLDQPLLMIMCLKKILYKKIKNKLKIKFKFKIQMLTSKLKKLKKSKIIILEIQKNMIKSNL